MNATENALDNLRNAPENEQGVVSLDQGDCDLLVDELDRLRAIEARAVEVLNSPPAVTADTAPAVEMMRRTARAILGERPTAAGGGSG